MLERKWSSLLRVAGVILVIPLWFIMFMSLFSKARFIVFGWAYGWALLFILFALIIDNSTARSEPKVLKNFG
jgi:hypothetical protein